MSAVDHRIMAAIEMLRSLDADGYSITTIVALSLSLVPTDRQAMLAAYRERAPAAAITAPVFASFAALWPEPIEPGRPRETATAAWRELSAADQAEAITGIAGWIELRKLGCFAGPGPVTLYLRDRSWRRISPHRLGRIVSAPLTERTSP